MEATTDSQTSNPSAAVEYFERRLAFETDCADVAARLSASDPHLVLLDVRSADDFAAGHVGGAVSMPYRTIDEQVLATWGNDTEFVTYCWGPHCNGATKGAAIIARLGCPVREMLGGVWGWQQEGYELVGYA